MASYLGKISAVVSANTRGFDLPLRASSAEVKSFASRVKNELGKASSDVSRSFRDILTPIQRFQKNLEAAVSQRLQFKGVEGAVQGIGQLEARLRELASAGSGAINVALQVAGAESVDRLVDGLGELDGKTLKAVIDVVNEDAIASAARKMQELRSLSDQVAKPLAGVSKSFSSLSAEVQAAFVPALAAAQREVQDLEAAFNRGGLLQVTEGQFEKVRQKVLQTADAVARLAEQSRLTGGLASGNELRFVAPGTVAELERAADLQRQASSLPASAISGDRQISSFIAAQRQASDEALRLRGNLEAALAAGEDTTAIEQSLARVTQRQIEYNNALERRINDAQGADNRRRAEAANRFLVVDQRESSLLSNQGRATQLPAGFLRSSAEASARRQIGGGTDAGIRQLDQLAQKVSSLRAQIDTLPATIGSQFIPQLQRAEQEFVRLRTSGTATAEQIDDAAGSVQRLGAQINRINRAQGIQSFADGLDDTALRGALGNLNALQQILNRVGATAGSDAARQFDRMRAAIQRATRDGTVGTDAFQNELRQLTQDAAKAAAATGKIGQKAAFREIQRGGDIARGGFDKLSLATQQAAFAIDDFFSATGDFTQKIRAVQNNVTQLAFILGGTTGLFIGLGVAIAAQATVALFKWINGGVEAKDRTEALNESLARQKSLVEDLKQAFDSLGNALTRGIFDEATERAREFQRALQDIQTKAGEQIESAAIVDSAVQQERALQASLRERLGKETDTTDRVLIQGDIASSEARERDRIEQIRRGSLSLSLEAIADDLEYGARVIAAARANDELIPSQSDQFRVGDAVGAALFEAVVSASQQAADNGDFRLSGARDVLIDRRNALQDNLRELDATLGSSVTNQTEIEFIREEIARITGTLESVNFALIQADVQLRQEALSSAKGIGESLARTRDLIDSAGAEFGPLARQQRALAERFARITEELTSGSSVGADGISGTSDDEKLTRSQIEARQEELDQLRKQSAELESASLSTRAFADALDRVAIDLANTVVSEAESAAVKARRDTNRAAAELVSLPGDATPAQRRAAERELRASAGREDAANQQAESVRRRRLQLESDRRAAEAQFQRNASAGTLGADLQQKADERDRLRVIQQEGQLTAEQAQKLEDLNSQISSAFEQTREARTLRRTANQIDTEQQQFNIRQERQAELESQRQQSLDRGQDLIKTPQQRAVDQGLTQFDDAVNASLQGIADSFGPLGDLLPQLDDGVLSLQELGSLFQQFPNLRQQFEQDLQVARDNIAGNIQQVVADFDRERSRPSRAPVQAQDVNTTQGRAELNRLLRGDDSNRDKPILQGIKDQIKVLNAIDRRIDEVSRVVGVAGA